MYNLICGHMPVAVLLDQVVILFSSWVLLRHGQETTLRNRGQEARILVDIMETGSTSTVHSCCYGTT